MAIAEDLAIIHDPEADQAFHVEQHGIDFIPESERWARPRDLFGMWGGASLNVEYFIYGAVLMGFGFTFVQAVSLIIIGNLSYFLLGICSLQGPDTGTTVFGINRAGFGPNGSRVIAIFNWASQVGFEIEGLILIVAAGLVLAEEGGLHPGTPAKYALVIGAVAVQFVLPFLGHATIVKTLRLLILPFVLLFVGLLIFVTHHATTHGVPVGATWQVYFAGLAFTIALSGLGWAENGNDYSRYLPRKSSAKGIVFWVFLGTAVPEILIMILGAATGTWLKNISANYQQAGTVFQKGTNVFQPFFHQGGLPSWFVVLFLVFCILQLFAINSLDLYSSGVTLQAIGVRVKRYQAVAIDSIICLGVTLYVVFNSSFTTYLKDFVDAVIVWIAPWVAIFLTDWILRRFRYVPSELQNTGKSSLYYHKGGIFWPALIAQLLGMAAAMSALNPTFSVPTWMNPIAAATGSNSFTRADFSIFLGMGVGALVYVALAHAKVRKQADSQEELLKEEGVL